MFWDTLACAFSNLCENELYHLQIILNMSKEETILNLEFVCD